MTSTRITTTSSSDYESLRYDGQRLDELWSEFVDMLAAIQAAPDFPLQERLTLAEPVVGTGGRTDWYGPPATAQVPTEQLQQQYRALYNAITTRIPTQRFPLASALVQALTIPNMEALYPGPQGPVLAPWGHRCREGKLNVGNLRYTEDIAPPPPAPQPAAPPQMEQAAPPPPAAPPLQKQPPAAPLPPAPHTKRPLGPWLGWVLLLCGLIALVWGLWHLPYLAGWFSTFSLPCRKPYLTLPWLLLALLGLVLLLLGAGWPLRRFFTEYSDRRRARLIGASGGLLQVILVWNDRNDLDLHIVCPDRGRIYYGAPEHVDGARLDHDANAAHSPITTRPVESVVWHNRAQPGLYSVSVDPYVMRARKASAFRVTVIHNGRVILYRRGIARENQRFGSTFDFVIPNS